MNETAMHSFSCVHHTVDRTQRDLSSLTTHTPLRLQNVLTHMRTEDKNLYPPSCPHSGKLSFLPCSTIKTPVPLRLMAEDSPFILFKSLFLLE